jgi:hypothetical protein
VEIALARRLERAEVLSTVAYVETRQSLQPAHRAGWLETGGVHAVYDGASSPLTQTFGLGVFEPPSGATLDTLEGFFAERGVATAHEVSSLATPSTWELLSSRGYSPIEASTVLVRPTTSPPVADVSHVTARRIEQDELASWSRVMIEGLSSESAELTAVMKDLAPLMAQSDGVHCFVAERRGQPIASGVLSIKNGTAVLGGASTIPAARRQGAQAALLQARLQYASELGIELAMLVAGPGSGSQRNAERKGFRPVYVRSKWLQPARTGALRGPIVAVD